MRKRAVPVAYVVLCSLLLAQHAEGRIPSISQLPKEPFVAYLETIVLPAAEGKSLADEALRTFYTTYLPIETRTQVSEDQFVEYSKHLPKFTHAGYNMAIKYSMGEPVQSEAHDQALIPAEVTAEYNPTTGLQVLAILGSIVGSLVSPSACCSRGPERGVTSSLAIFRVVKEDDAWKLVLPENVIADIQKVTLQTTVRRYTLSTTVSEGGVTVRVIGVTFEKDTTALRLSVENASGNEARLLNAFSLAALTDESGSSYSTRILRSTFPEKVTAGSSAVATLIFDPVPFTTRKLSLTLPSITVGDSEMSLKLDIVLSPCPLAVSRTPIPGEPVLMYFLAVSRPFFTREDGLRAIYQTYLSHETRGQITEREFVDYSEKDPATGWRLNAGSFAGGGFTIGEPIYSTSKDRASIPVSATSAATTSCVVREGDTWKLALCEDALKDIIVKRCTIRCRRHVEDAVASRESLTIQVDDAILEKEIVTLHLIVKNDNDADVNLFNMIYGATLTDERGQTYPARIVLGTLPEKVSARSSIAGNLVFEAVPVNSKKWQLTVPDLRVGDKVFTVSLDVPLGSWEVWPHN